MVRRRDPGGGDPSPPEDAGLSGEDRRLWARVTGTVTPAERRKSLRVVQAPVPPDNYASSDKTPSPSVRARARSPAPPPKPAPVAPDRRPHGAPDVLEPRRQRRLSRERDPIEARIDLHGCGRFEAEDQLQAFLFGAQARGLRAVLVVTGQGRRGGGIIRASAPEWLRAPALRGVVSGFATAHRRHGGDGALYVTLRRPGG